MRSPSQFGIALVLLVGAGCSDSSGPRTHVTRVYELESVGGRPLPTVIDSAATQWHTVLWDSLTIDFTADTTFETRGSRYEFPGFEPQEDETWTADAVVLHGDSVALIPLNCLSICVSREGLIKGSSIALKSQYAISSNPEYVYRLVSSSQ